MEWVHFQRGGSEFIHEEISARTERLLTLHHLSSNWRAFQIGFN